MRQTADDGPQTAYDNEMLLTVEPSVVCGQNSFLLDQSQA